MDSTQLARHRPSISVAMIAASVLAHGALYAAVRTTRPSGGPIVETVEFELAPIRPQPPPAMPAPEAAAAPAPTPSPLPPRPRVARRPPAATPPPHAPAPSTPASQPSEAPPPVVRIGISLGSTTSGGGFAVGVGNSLMGTADTRAADPDSVHPLTGAGPVSPAFVAATRVNTLPRLLEQPKAVYPDEARKAEIEGRVLLLLAIDSQGRVTHVRVLEGPGFGLEQAAREAALRFRFSPATVDGEPVATEIRFTYTFLLE